MRTLRSNKGYTHVDHIVERTVLRNSNERRLMVGRRVDAGKTIGTRGETIRNVRAQDTAGSRVIQALEEGEASGVSDCGVANSVNRLNDDVTVALDLALSVHLLGCTEVVLVCVHEVTGLEIADSHGDGEGGVGGDGVEVLGVGELR